MKTKAITQTVTVSMDAARKVCDTPGNGTYGVWVAPQIYEARVDRKGVLLAGRVSADLCAWLETNGDPLILPHPTHEPESLAIVLADAGLSRTELDAALADIAWYD